MAARRWAALVLAAIAVLAAASVPSAQADTGFATVRAAHFAPDVPPVDVYATNSTGARALVASDLGYGAVSGYARVPAGRYQLSLLAHGAAATSAPLLAWSVDLAAGATYTAAGEGFGANHHGALISDDLTAPVAGHARVRFVQSANAVPAATISPVGAAPLVAALPFTAVSAYASMTAGPWTLAVTGAGTRDVQHFVVAAGSVYSMVVLDAQGGGVTVQVVLDAAGATSIPTSAVPAGGGGTAAHIVDRPIAATSDYQLAIIALLAAAALLALGRPGAGVDWLRRVNRR